MFFVVCFVDVIVALMFQGFGLHIVFLWVCNNVNLGDVLNCHVKVCCVLTT